MAIDTVDQTVTTQAPPSTAGEQTVRTDRSHTTVSGPEGSEQTRRIVVFLFGLIQVVIGLRVVLLLLNAREANGIVSGILNLSQVFVAPFNGILRTDALTRSGSTFDVTAIVALVGWTVLELIVIWAVGMFRRQQA
jgi:hypothetical protein